MSITALVPSHFIHEIQPSAEALGVELEGYDQRGIPAVPSGRAVACFRWWLTPEQGDELLIRNPIRWVHTGSAGVNHILTPAFLASGALLTNSAGVHAPSIAEWVVAAILAEEKQLETIWRQQRQRVWHVVRTHEVQGRHALILGAGCIAREISARLRGLGIRVTAMSRGGGPQDGVFDAVLPSSRILDLAGDADWLILAAPLTGETRGIVSSSVIGALPPRARLVNVARGELVDEAALLEALRARRIAGAILDVFETEPLPEQHPFWEMETVRVLPHTTWRSEQVHARQIALFLDNLGRFARGEPMRNVVDPARGY